MSESARQVRSQRRSWAHPGSGHDRIVRVALLALPVGILLLAVFLALAPLTMGGDVSFVLDKNKVDVASERLRIQAAEYRGEDDRGRAFRLRAGSAVQRSSADPVVHIDALAAQIRLEDGPAQIVANQGRYNMDAQSVAVDGPVQFQAADGYKLSTRDATVDLKTRTLQSGGAVEGSTPMGNFSADRLTADLEARTVTLNGNARLRIYPKRAKGN